MAAVGHRLFGVRVEDVASADVVAADPAADLDDHGALVAMGDGKLLPGRGEGQGRLLR